MAIDPLYASAWGRKAHALSTLGRCEEEIGCYDRLLAIDPRVTKALLNKGIALGHLGRHEEASECFDNALATDHGNVAAWYNRALAQDILRHSREALIAYQQFIELAPPEYAQQRAHARQRLRELESEGA